MSYQDLVAAFEAEGGVVQQCNPGERTVFRALATFMGIEKSSGDWTPDKYSILTFRLKGDEEKMVRIYTAASWADTLVKGGVYDIQYKMRFNDRTFSAAPYAFCGREKPVLTTPLNHSTDPSLCRRIR